MIAHMAHFTNSLLHSLIICCNIILSSFDSRENNRFVMAADFRTATGTSRYSLKFLTIRKCGGKYAGEGTLEISIVWAFLYFFAISVATIPPIDKPIVTK